MAKKLWGGRFTKKIDPDFFEFQKSIQYDYKLARYDIMHSLIHINALSKNGEILKAGEKERLESVLSKVGKEIAEEIKNEQFKPKDSEDIHTEIQNRVEKKLGPKYSSLALKLHTLRSRNDQIAFDLRLYLADKSLGINTLLFKLISELLCSTVASLKKKEEFVGYTHTQRAQIIYFADYLEAYAEMLGRDASRIEKFEDSLFIYIGAGALTGSSLDRSDYNAAIKEYMKKYSEIGKIKPPDNPLDNVSDRDFIVEFLSILSIMQMHFSRLAEDLILYSTKEFNLIDLPEEFCTGSSLMPHKKNPDLLELIRGNTGKIYGNLMSILTIMKGLPLTYNRDMQLDKEPLFSSVETIEAELKLLTKFISKVKVNNKGVDAIKEDVSLYATEFAEELVMKQGLPFKVAHDIVGRFIILLEKNKGKIENIEDKELEQKCPGLTKKMIKRIMKPGYVVSSRKTFVRKIKK